MTNIINNTEIDNLTIIELHDLIIKGKLLASDIISHYINNIKEYNSKYNALIYDKNYENSNFDKIIFNLEEKAKITDEKIKSGKKISNLDSVVISIKDLFCMNNVRTTACSNMLKSFIPHYESTITNRLFNDNKAYFIGKANMDEFAMGSTNKNSIFGPVKNIYYEDGQDNIDLVPGGSSGGSAVSLAANMCKISMGSDTGGSVRQPAAFCNVIGFKPSYGRLSRYGMIAFASSLDQAGIFAKNISDIALIFENIAGYDVNDSTTLKSKNNIYQNINFSNKINKDIKGKKIALIKNFINNNDIVINKDIIKKYDELVKYLQKEGAEVKEIELKYIDYATSIYYIIAPAEASSNLARYDGIRYGSSIMEDYSNKEGISLEELYLETRSKFFGDEVKKRLMIGTYVLSSGYYDAYYLKSLKIKRLIFNEIKEIFTDFDAIITPTTPNLPFPINNNKLKDVDIYNNDIFTTFANITGMPAISMPVGFSSNNLPIGMQIVTNNFKEDILFNIASNIENFSN